MMRVEEAGYPIVLTVHDEILSEVPDDFGSVAEFERLMVPEVEWAGGLPIAVGAWEGQRYAK
jgi:DNA polymerase